VTLTLLARCLNSTAGHHGQFIRQVLFGFITASASVTEETERMEATHTILLFATQLTSFWSIHPVSPVSSHLHTIRAATANRLEWLDVFISNTQAPTLLPCLAHFSSLKRLGLEFEADNGSTRAMLDDLPPLRLPSLDTVKLLSGNENNFGSIEHWFLKSSFSHVHHVHLGLPAFPQAHDMTALMHFLNRHQNTCSTLTFHKTLLFTRPIPVNYPWEKLNASVACAARHVIFISCMPSNALFCNWPPSSKMTRLSLQNTFGRDDRETNRLAETSWSIPSLLSQMGDADFGPRGLQLHISFTQERFTWDCADRSARHSKFVGELVRYVVQLAAKGVSIVDENGVVLLPAHVPGF
jgi:hypothetical protein